VLVGLELRQNTIVARSAAFQNMGHGWVDLGEDPDWPEVARRFMTQPFTDDTWEALPEPDRWEIVLQWVANFRRTEIGWRQVQLGLLDAPALNYFGNDAPLNETAWVGDLRVVWPELKPFMSLDFPEGLEAALLIDGIVATP
jgi:hypothetical protein